LVARRCADRDRPVRRARRPCRRDHGHCDHDRDASDGDLVEFLDGFLRVIQVVGERGEHVGNVRDDRHDPDHGRGVERGSDGHLRRVVMGALVPSSTLWYTARGTGLVTVIMLSVLHGLSSGTDAATTWARAVYVACAALVLAGVGWRVGASVRSPASASARPVTLRGVAR
jgi:hypothetical protein